jgi:hypothetical protein
MEIAGLGDIKQIGSVANAYLRRVERTLLGTLLFPVFAGVALSDLNDVVERFAVIGDPRDERLCCNDGWVFALCCRQESVIVTEMWSEIRHPSLAEGFIMRCVNPSEQHASGF